MKMTLLFLGRNGAGPKYAIEMAKVLSLVKDIEELQIIIPTNIDNLVDWKDLAHKKNINLKTVITYSNKVEFLKSFFNPLKYLAIRKNVKNFDPDWIYLPMGSLLNFWILPLLKKYKIVYTLHDPILHQGEKSLFIELLRRIEINSSNKIILLNNYFKKHVIDFYKFKNENVVVIPHAGFFGEQEPKEITQFSNKILFLGRIEKYKGIDLLLDTLDDVLKSKKDLMLTIAGKGDLTPYSNKIHKLKSNITLENDWLTEEKIETLLRNHDFVVLPYIDASQSGVIPLAFGNGKIVVATNVGALAEQVPEDLGFCVNPNAKELSNAILNIYNSSFQELNSKNKRVYQYAKENLTWESSVNKLLTCLEET